MGARLRLGTTVWLRLTFDSDTLQEIIRQLVENSESFQQKTEFSQAKYLKKKQKKYVCTLSIRASSF